MQDLFGIQDAVKRLSAPAGLELAHQDGFSWARQGVDFATSTKLTADDWNRIIAQLRGVLTATPGFDPTGRDPGDPLLLRDAIIDFATAKIVELLPDTVLDQADELAAALASITAFVNTIVAAVPTNLNASNLTTGTVPDARLPSWLKHLAANVDGATDFDSITAPGWHANLLGTTNPNAPIAGRYYHVLNLGLGASITQIAFPYASGINLNGLFMRPRLSGVWGSWVRIGDKTYNDTLYLAKAGGALTGALTGTSASFTSALSAVGGSTTRGVNGALATLTGAANEQALVVRGNGTGGSFLTFERPSAYAVHFGLDTDNILKIGGWSMGLVAHAVHHDGNSGRGAPDAVLEDQKASGTAGGTSTAGAFETRALNTEVRDLSGLVTLASNQFTVAADGYVDWSAPAFGCGRHVTRLWNVTDSVEVIRGTSEYASGTSVQTRSFGGTSITSGKTYRIEHRVEAGRATDGYGVASSFGVEVFCRVRLWRR